MISAETVPVLRGDMNIKLKVGVPTLTKITYLDSGNDFVFLSLPVTPDDASVTPDAQGFLTIIWTQSSLSLSPISLEYTGLV